MNIKPDESKLLAKSIFRAGNLIGLSDSEVRLIVGLDQAEPNEEIAPGRETYALRLIECYQYLYRLTGGKYADMEHWIRTMNNDTGGIPAQQMTEPGGLDKVLGYLSRMCDR